MNGKDFFGRTQKRVSGETANSHLIGQLQAELTKLRKKLDKQLTQLEK